VKVYVDRRADEERIADHRDFGLVIRRIANKGAGWFRAGAAGRDKTVVIEDFQGPGGEAVGVVMVPVMAIVVVEPEEIAPPKLSVSPI
jgi:hypothetical protein